MKWSEQMRKKTGHESHNAKKNTDGDELPAARVVGRLVLLPPVRLPNILRHALFRARSNGRRAERKGRGLLACGGGGMPLAFSESSSSSRELFGSVAAACRALALPKWC